MSSPDLPNCRRSVSVPMAKKSTAKPPPPKKLSTNPPAHDDDVQIPGPSNSRNQSDVLSTRNLTNVRKTSSVTKQRRSDRLVIDKTGFQRLCQQSLPRKMKINPKCETAVRAAFQDALKGFTTNILHTTTHLAAMDDGRLTAVPGDVDLALCRLEKKKR